MKLWNLLKSAARNLFRKQQVESQLDEEVRAYVDLVTQERIAAGISPSEARRTALADFGGVEQVKQAVRNHRAGVGLELLGQDIHYGLRQFWRNPGFTVTVILTLALSVGANTAIFSLVNALLLKSLPYARPDRMGSIYTRITGPVSTDERHHLNGEQWELLRDNVPALISGRVQHQDFRCKSAGRLPGAVSSSGTHLSPLPRCVGRPPHHRTQFLRRRGPSPWTEHGHPELRRVAKNFRRRHQYPRAQHSVEGRAVHRDRSVARRCNHTLERRSIHGDTGESRRRRRGNKLCRHHAASRRRNLAGGGCPDQSCLVSPR